MSCSGAQTPDADVVPIVEDFLHAESTASAASVAGARKLREEGIIAPSDRVVCILTGHQLKDPTATVAYHSADQKTFDEVLGERGVKRAMFANRAVQVANDLDDIIRAIEVYS